MEKITLKKVGDLIYVHPPVINGWDLSISPELTMAGEGDGEGIGSQIKAEDKIEWMAERLFQMHVLKHGLFAIADTEAVEVEIKKCFDLSKKFYDFSEPGK